MAIRYPVSLGGPEDVYVPPILECFGYGLGGPDVDIFLRAGPDGDDLVFQDGWLLFSHPLGPSLANLGGTWARVRWKHLFLWAGLDGGGL